MKDALAPTSPKNFVTIVSISNHSFSRGTCHGRSAKPHEPILDPRYLSHPLDLVILATQTQCIEMIVRAEPITTSLKPGGRLPEGKEASTLAAAKEIVKE